MRQYLSGDITNRGIARTDPDKAIADYTMAIGINSKNVDAYSSRGNLWLAKGEPDKTIADCTRAIEINPKDAVAYCNRGVAWQMKRDLDKAIADYSQAIENNPKFAQVHYNRGLVWLKKGELDKAIIDYSRATEINPKYADAYNNLSVVWLRKGEFDKAITSCTKAIGINPNDAVSYANRGFSYAATGQYPKAMADISTLFDLAQYGFDKVITSLSNTLKMAWQKDGKMREITTEFSKETGMDLTLATAYFVLSYALWNSGRHDEAKKAFETLNSALPEKIPLPALKFFGEMLALMPPDMKEDGDVKAATKSISGKHR